jgi:hypothetical protein
MRYSKFIKPITLVVGFNKLTKVWRNIMTNIIKKGYKLVHESTGKDVYLSELVVDFRGDKSIVKGGSAPHKPSSTGRVWVSDITNRYHSDYFPSIFGLKWREL